jgi:hypothetical protein
MAKFRFDKPAKDRYSKAREAKHLTKSQDNHEADHVYKSSTKDRSICNKEWR